MQVISIRTSSRSGTCTFLGWRGSLPADGGIAALTSLRGDATSQVLVRNDSDSRGNQGVPDVHADGHVFLRKLAS